MSVAVVAPARRLIVGLAVLFVLAGADPASAGTPILVVQSSSPTRFSSYVPEIMHAEGLNGFSVADLPSVNPATLAPYEVVVLGDVNLSPDQAAALSGWVAAGGNLIALSPDPQLAGLLGIAPTGGTASDDYLAVDTSKPPGAGIVGGTIQFHGTADLYTLAGAEPVAMLYSDAVNATSHPAVTLRTVGTAGGEAAAFTFDLAQSIVYTRQGNPAWAGQERDDEFPIRPNDLFFGMGAEPHWVDPGKIHIPQADELQRLLANLITHMNRERTPVPRFWYLPRGERAAVVMTGDDHARGGTAARFAEHAAASPPNCSVAEWQCVRSTSYIYANAASIAPAAAEAYEQQGFEISIHPNDGPGCGNPDQEDFETGYAFQLGQFASVFPRLKRPSTARFHCVSWPDWATHAKVEDANQIRLDTNYYHFPQEWGGIRGYLTGSGEIMKFADSDGSTINVYQAHTYINDEWTEERDDTSLSAPFIKSLLEWATGPQGFHGLFTMNMHTDNAESAPGSREIVREAQRLDVPVISARQALDWVQGRDGSSFSDFTWGSGRLGFTISAGAGANGLQGMVPINSALGPLQGLTRDGAQVSVTAQTVKGVDYGFFPASSGRYEARYPFALPSTSGPRGGAVRPATDDGIAPRVRLKLPRKITLRKLLRKGLAYRLTCSEACSVRVRLTMKVGKRKIVSLASKRRKLGGSSGARIVVKPGRKAAKRLRRVRPARLTLRIKAIDTFGNARTVVRRVRLIY